MVGQKAKDGNTLGFKEDVWPALEALKWLTLRICINNDLSEFLLIDEKRKESLNKGENLSSYQPVDLSMMSPDASFVNAFKQETKKEKDLMAAYRMKFTLISLQWHCALIDSFTVENLVLKFEALIDERFPLKRDLTKIQMIEFFKEYFNNVFPHISTRVIVFLPRQY